MAGVLERQRLPGRGSMNSCGVQAAAHVSRPSIVTTWWVRAR